LLQPPDHLLLVQTWYSTQAAGLLGLGTVSWDSLLGKGLPALSAHCCGLPLKTNNVCNAARYSWCHPCAGAMLIFSVSSLFQRMSLRMHCCSNTS